MMKTISRHRTKRLSRAWCETSVNEEDLAYSDGVSLEGLVCVFWNDMEFSFLELVTGNKFVTV